MTFDDRPSRKLSEPIESALQELVSVSIEAVGADEPRLLDTLDGVRDALRASPTWPRAASLELAPRDGSAFLATGIHDRDDPPGAARGVKAGFRWWAILLFDVWREPHRFVFAKDGAEPWSEPQLWYPLPDLLPEEKGQPPFVLPVAMTPAIAEVLGLPIFRTVPTAHLFRAAGAEIKPRVEDEQAHVLFRFLHLALQHEDGWAREADRLVAEARATVEARKAEETTP